MPLRWLGPDGAGHEIRSGALHENAITKISLEIQGVEMAATGEMSSNDVWNRF
jgi:hypothetical protein